MRIYNPVYSVEAKLRLFLQLDLKRVFLRINKLLPVEIMMQYIGSKCFLAFQSLEKRRSGEDSFSPALWK